MSHISWNWKATRLLRLTCLRALLWQIRGEGSNERLRKHTTYELYFYFFKEQDIFWLLGLPKILIFIYLINLFLLRQKRIKTGPRLTWSKLTIIWQNWAPEFSYQPWVTKFKSSHKELIWRLFNSKSSSVPQ